MPSLFYIRQFRDREIDWLVKRLEYEVDYAAPNRGGQREYRGDILPLLFTGMYEGVSSELLKNKTLQQKLRNKVRFNEFLENHVKEDPKSWQWALEQGWGAVIRPYRPAKSRAAGLDYFSLQSLYSHMQNTMAEQLYGCSSKEMITDLFSRKAPWERTDQKIYPRPENAPATSWDTWIRSASSKYPELNVYLFEPQWNDILALASIPEDRMQLGPPMFWGVLQSRFPEVYEHLLSVRSASEVLGEKWTTTAARRALQGAVGVSSLTPLVVPEMELNCV